MTTPHESAGAVVEVGPVAHGGHCVARLDGRVVFVRHALPGETVRLNVTDTTHDSFWRADAVEVLEPSPDRVAPRCPVSGPGRCGGCDFQHVSLDGQRRLKTQVLAEQLDRLAGVDLGRRGRAGRDPRHRGRPALADADALPGGRSTATRACASTAATRSSRCPPRAARSPIPPPRRWSTSTWPPGVELTTVAHADPATPRSPSTRPAATGGWPSTASGRCIRVPPTPWSGRCSTDCDPNRGSGRSISTAGSGCSPAPWSTRA